MPVWSIILISAVAVVLLVGLCYVVYRFGYSKAAYVLPAVGVSALLFDSLSSFFKDKVDKTDVRDAMLALGDVSRLTTLIIMKRKEGVELVAMREDLIAEVKKILGRFPEVAKEFTDDMISSEVDALIALLASLV